MYFLEFFKNPQAIWYCIELSLWISLFAKNNFKVLFSSMVMNFAGIPTMSLILKCLNMTKRIPVAISRRNHNDTIIGTTNVMAFQGKAIIHFYMVTLPKMDFWDDLLLKLLHIICVAKVMLYSASWHVGYYGIFIAIANLSSHISCKYHLKQQPT